MGRIIAPHGIKGWIKIKVFTETPESLLDYPTWWLNARAGWQEYKVAEAEWRTAGLVARLDGHDDRSATEALKGVEVGVPRSALPPALEGEYYWSDLIGLKVVNKQDEPLGVIEGLVETGANDVLIVRAEDGFSPANDKVERLIPYIDPVIVSVDLSGRRMVVDWGVDWT